MSDTKNSTEKSNSSQKTTKLSAGKIGYYKGVFATIRTTRAFWFDKDTKINWRGVELISNGPLDADIKKTFKNCYNVYDEELGHNVIFFLDILDFRKNFVYSETASMIYGKE